MQRPTRPSRQSNNSIEAQVAASQKRSQRRRQVRQKKRQKARRARFKRLLFLGLVLGLSLFSIRTFRRSFLSSQLDELPSLRSAANGEILSAFLVGDTLGRPLNRMEKAADASTLKEILLATPQELRAYQGDLEEALDQWISQAKSSANDRDFFACLSAMVQLAQGQQGGLVGPERFTLLQKNLGFGFYAEDSPYGLALSSSRAKDRYARLKKQGLGASSKVVEKGEKKEDRPLFPSPSGQNTGAFKKPQLRTDQATSLAILSNLAFEDGALDQQKAELTKLLEEASAYQHLVIDLRNSGGSSLEYWTQGILPHLTKLPFALSGQIRLAPGAKDYLDYFARKERMLTFSLENVREDQAASYVGDFTVSNGESTQLTLNRLPYLLVDETSSGAAETFAEYCSQNNLAVVYGKATAGQGWNLPPFLFLLPHSGLLVELTLSQGQGPKQDPNSKAQSFAVKELEGQDLLQSLVQEIL